MRIAPDQSRLRIVALVCWALGAWWLLQPGALAGLGLPPGLGVAGLILAILLLAIGLSFWLLGTDRQAGVVIDRKGLSLNLGHSSAFVGWENIAALGVSRRRSSLLALGSRDQLGLRLHNPEQYLQSYEARVPSATGPLAGGVLLVRRLLEGGREPHQPRLATVEALRRRTGYDIIIPEAQLGGRATSFVALLEGYRLSPEQRRSLPTGLLVSRI